MTPHFRTARVVHGQGWREIGRDDELPFKVRAKLVVRTNDCRWGNRGWRPAMAITPGLRASGSDPENRVRGIANRERGLGTQNHRFDPATPESRNAENRLHGGRMAKRRIQHARPEIGDERRIRWHRVAGVMSRKAWTSGPSCRLLMADGLGRNLRCLAAQCHTGKRCDRCSGQRQDKQECCHGVHVDGLLRSLSKSDAILRSPVSARSRRILSSVAIEAHGGGGNFTGPQKIQPVRSHRPNAGEFGMRWRSSRPDAAPL
jgi:hypothetical protein